MRVSGSEADKQAGAPPKSWAAVLFFGPNSGLVRERADKVARAIVPDANDGFRIADLAGDALRKDPARLQDEAAAISMFGGRRVVRVRDAGEGLSDLFSGFLASPIGDSLVVVEAGDLARNSSLRKVFEDAKTAAAVECADDKPEDAAKLIKDTLTQAGWQIDAEALHYLAEALSLDRRLLRSEVEKLVLYLGEAKDETTLTRAQAAMLIGDSGSVEGDEIADAVAAGNLKQLDALFIKAADAGMSWTSVVGATLRLFQRMAAFAEGGGGGSSFGRPSYYEQRMQAQVRNWDRRRLLTALKLLAQAEADTRTTGLPEAAIAQRVLLVITDMGARKAAAARQ